MSQDRFYATGKRKTAVARVWLKPGNGAVVVNNLEPEQYFGSEFARRKLEHPFALTETLEKFDVFATIRGSGKSSQADAMCHGIAKALLDVDPAHRLTLKKAGLLTRDPRCKERKKYGQKGARARYQYSKR